MTTRLLAAAILVATAAVAWLAITFTLVARALQATIALSLVYVAYLALRGYQAMREARRVSAQDERPWVTLMVAARNEAPVIAKTLAGLVAQDYADESGPRFDVLLVDDGSTDETGALASLAAAEHPDRLRVARREPGDGPRMKAAALSHAHPQARGEVIGVVDADASVAPDFVSRVMEAWRLDPGAVAIQAQRRAHNRNEGWFAAAQDEELLTDMASQCGRRATDGTAELRGNGMFVRRDALERVGGWNPTALTEDLELSTRLVAAGERIALASAAEVGEEAVTTLWALWRQRLRWAEGSIRRLIELGPGLLRAEGVPLSRKLDFLAFTAEFVIPPLFVTTVIAALITIPLPRPADWTVPASLFVGYGIGTFLLALAGVAADGQRGPGLIGRAGRGSLFLSHWLLVVPAALARIAVGREATTFVQTRRVGHLPER
ncbi:MAG TPA: glycosyltransferase family 2 protein [Candidatus Limnocylindria bacterium]|nr:glycosyltransferase family 2 protein [Candidatus Limnocylindria bacterium]